MQTTNDELTLLLDGVSIQGWNAIRMTRGIERVPGDFELTLTERFPGQIAAVTVNPGASCQVLLGADVVLTGYVDRYVPSISAEQHEIRVIGRGKCCDLVDCSAEWPGGQISGTSALDIARKLAAPYGIPATLRSGVAGGPIIPQFNLILGETAWEIIERVCRYSALICYEDASGALVLDQAGTTAHASGFAEGVNVQSASISYSMDRRYSDYVAFRQSVETLDDLGANGVDYNAIGRATDTAVSRHRQLDIIAMASAWGQEVADATARWDLARRYGRSFACRLVTDSWRDSDGVLWQPNRLVQIELPTLKMSMAQWVISEVTYQLDEQGTTATLVIMPPQAFQAKPVLLQTLPIMEIFQAQRGNGLVDMLGPSGVLGFQTVDQITQQAVSRLNGQR